MTSLPRVSLEDTLTLLQLVRETALAQGRETQAKQLSPVMEQMQEIVSTARKSEPSAPPSTGVMGQSDFRTLLEISKGRAGGSPMQSEASSAMERNRLIQAMSEASMSDIDIARQFSMTREEVRLVLSTNQKGRA